MILADDKNDFGVRTDHLDYLTEVVAIADDSLGILHIYSDYPDYEYVHPPKEGIACVDDAARGVVAYLKHYESTGREKSLRLAKHLLQFVFYMQAHDGGFYNFVWQDYSRNRLGETSHNNGFTWWACRAVWAMGYARYQFGAWDSEPSLRDTIDVRMERALGKLARQKWTPNQWQNLGRFKVPAAHWMLDGWVNKTSELTLGLVYYAAATGNGSAASLARQLCDGITNSQIGDRYTYPYGLFPDGLHDIAMWHAWGSREVQALAMASQILPDPKEDWSIVAKRAADNFYTHMLLTDRITRMQSIPFNETQINYDMAPVVNGLVELYRLTCDEIYAQKAALFAAWWFGDNPLEVNMYDQESGRFFDGITGERWNRNSGGETNTEGIMALLDVQSLGEYSNLVFAYVRSYQPVISLEAEEAEIVAGKPQITTAESYGSASISGSEYVQLVAGDTMRLKFTVENSYDQQTYYFLELHHLVGDDSAQITCLIDGEVIGRTSGGKQAERHFWITPIPERVRLADGTHTLTLTTANESGMSAVDMLRIHPVVERKTWVTPEGEPIEFERRLMENR